MVANYANWKKHYLCHLVDNVGFVWENGRYALLAVSASLQLRLLLQLVLVSTLKADSMHWDAMVINLGGKRQFVTVGANRDVFFMYVDHRHSVYPRPWMYHTKSVIMWVYVNSSNGPVTKQFTDILTCSWSTHNWSTRRLHISQTWRFTD